ncbi:MAG TPA: radical SAM protein [Vicinamibacterales bacterium]|nr:radical SAM protein [Vicinamibacterales bacterium]
MTGSLGIVVTADCNLRCAYCYQDRKQPRQMSWPTMSRALDLLTSSNRRRADVTVLGGEPLLGYPLIVRAVRRLGRRFPARRRPDCVIATNGLLLTPRRLAFLERHRFDIQLSFDGVAPSQDLRSPGSYAILDRLLDRLNLRHRAYFRRRVMVAVTVTAPAIPYLADSFEYFLSKGVEDIAIGPAMGHPRLSAAQTRELDRQFRLIFARSLRHYRATERVPLRLFRKTAAAPKKSPESDLACVAAIGRDLAVDVDGEVYPCALLVRSCQRVARPPLDRRLAAMSLGPVSDLDGLQRRRACLPHAALAAGIFRPQSRKRSRFGVCAACRHAAVCFVCPIACAKNPGSADANRIPEFQCAFNRIALEYRRRFPIQR